MCLLKETETQPSLFHIGWQSQEGNPGVLTPEPVLFLLPCFFFTVRHLTCRGKDERMGRVEAGETSNDVTSGCWKRSQAQCWNRSWGLQDSALVVKDGVGMGSREGLACWL